MAERPYYTLADPAAQKLKDLLHESARAMREPIESQERLIADLYTGRDANTPGLANDSLRNLLSAYPDRALDGSWQPPEMGVNVMLSRLQQILASLVPSKPTFHVKPRVARAARLAESQNKISQFATDHGKLRQAMKQAAFQGMLAPYFAVKFEENKDARGDWEKVCYKSIEARDCGYEAAKKPRFKWHSYKCQYGDLPQEISDKVTIRGEKPNPWDMIRVTEVYHDGFRHGHKRAQDKDLCPVSYFVALDEPQDGDTPSLAQIASPYGRDFGQYVLSKNIRRCPLVIKSFNEPAPGEFVPPVEVVNWLPHIRKIVHTIVQINREVRNLNTIILYDKEAVKSKTLDSIIRDGIPSETVFVDVDTQFAGERGVNAVMRPVEQSDNLASLLAVLQNDLALFDDMIGLSPMERGMAEQPRKSATEAQSITAAGSRRSRQRLEIIAEAFSEILQVQFEYQRDLYGKTLDIPHGKGGIAERLDVPDPKAAQFAFEVDPVELGHLSKQGDADALFNALTVVSNTLATFQGAIPKPVRELLRRVLVAQGMPDADLLIDLPTLEAGPVDRLIEHLMSGDPIQVKADDQHQAYIAYYEGILPKLFDAQPEAADSVSQAIMEHNVYIRRAAAANINAAAQPNVVPGVTQNGPDNAIQSALLAGEPPPFPQSQGF